MKLKLNVLLMGMALLMVGCGDKSLSNHVNYRNEDLLNFSREYY